jgi:chromosome segregation ATPase
LAGKDERVSIEQAMYFALGFLVAGLFMLMFLPAFWRRAMRLSMRRLQMLAPLSREEAIAERDLLRAEFALRQRRMEQEMAAVKESKTQDLLDVGRHALRIAGLDDALKKSEARGRELEHRLQDAQKTAAQRAELLASTQTALLELTQRAERGVASLRALRSDHEDLGRETKQALTRVATHETKIGDLGQENAELRRELSKLQDDFLEIAAEAKRLGAADAELARANEDLKRLSLARDALEETLLDAQSRAKEEEERQKSEIAHLETALRLARAEARDAADELGTLRADNSMLQGAIEALRADRVRRRNGGGGGDAEDIADLRKEIASFAASAIGEAPRSEELGEATSARRA